MNIITLIALLFSFISAASTTARPSYRRLTPEMVEKRIHNLNRIKHKTKMKLTLNQILRSKALIWLIPLKKISVQILFYKYQVDNLTDVRKHHVICGSLLGFLLFQVTSTVDGPSWTPERFRFRCKSGKLSVKKF